MKQNSQGHQWILSSWKEIHRIPTCVPHCVLYLVRWLDENGFLIHAPFSAWPRLNSWFSFPKVVSPFRVPVLDAQARTPGVTFNPAFSLILHISGTRYHWVYMLASLCQLEECFCKQQGRGPIQPTIQIWHLWKETSGEPWGDKIGPGEPQTMMLPNNASTVPIRALDQKLSEKFHFEQKW